MFQAAQDDSTFREHLFEACVRSSLCGAEAQFCCRNCHGKTSKHNKEFFLETLGGCIDTQRTMDIVGDCKKGADRSIFHSHNESEPLVDFMCKFGKVHYAIQVTVSAVHNCSKDKVEAFLSDLKLLKGETLNFVCAAPDGEFGRFTANPV